MDGLFSVLNKRPTCIIMTDEDRCPSDTGDDGHHASAWRLEKHFYSPFVVPVEVVENASIRPEALLSYQEKSAGRVGGWREERMAKEPWCDTSYALFDA